MVNLQRRLWPWLVGIPLAIVVTIYGIWRWRASKDREEYERQYPVANSQADTDAIARAAGRWKASAVIAGVAKPPDIATLQVGDACDAKLDRVLEFRAGEADDAKNQIAWVFESARRGRYFDENEHERTIRHIQSPILVIAVADAVAPEMMGSKEYAAGYRTGAAYVYDIDGTLRCAGEFQAQSSDVVKFTTWKSDDPRLNGNPERDAKRAVHSDLEQRMHDAVVASLRRIK